MKELIREGKKTRNDVHLVRPVKTSEFKKTLKRKKTLYMPKSTYGRLSNWIQNFLKKRKVKVVYETLQGRPISKDPKQMRDAIKLYKAGFSYREIEKKTGLPKSTVHYLVKKAKRNKIKSGNKIYKI